MLEQNIKMKFVADKLAKSLELEYKDILTQNETEDLFSHKYRFLTVSLIGRISILVKYLDLC